MLFYGRRAIKKGGWTGIVAPAVRPSEQAHKAQTQEAATVTAGSTLVLLLFYCLRFFLLCWRHSSIYKAFIVAY